MTSSLAPGQKNSMENLGSFHPFQLLTRLGLVPVTGISPKEMSYYFLQGPVCAIPPHWVLGLLYRAGCRYWCLGRQRVRLPIFWCFLQPGLHSEKGIPAFTPLLQTAGKTKSQMPNILKLGSLPTNNWVLEQTIWSLWPILRVFVCLFVLF